MTINLTARGAPNNGAGTNANATITSDTFTPTAGNLLVVFAWGYLSSANPTFTVTDTFGAGTGSWSTVGVSRGFFADSYYARGVIATKLVEGTPSSGAITVTRTPSGSADQWLAGAMIELSADGDLVVAQTATGNSDGGSVTVTLPGALTSGSWLFSACATMLVTTFTDPSGWTSVATSVNTAYNNCRGRAVYHTSPSSNSLTWSPLGTSLANTAVLLEVYEDAPPGGEDVDLEGVGDAAALHTGALAVARPVEGTSAAAAAHTGRMAGGNASGIPLPGDTAAGWDLLWADDFDTDFDVGDVDGPTGAFPEPYTLKLYGFVDGTPDTANRTSNPPGAAGIYQPSETVSAADSTLIVAPFVDAGVPKAAAIVVLAPPDLWGQTYGRYSVCFRIAEANAGWKLAWLLWPDSEAWPTDGEIDYPEGSITGGIHANMHHPGMVDTYDHFEAGVEFGADWHVATIEWAEDFVRFWLDNAVVGTSWVNVPDQSMHWVLQTETDVGIAQPTLDALVLIDWVAIWAIDGFTAPAPTPGENLADDFEDLDRSKWITNGDHTTGQVAIDVNLTYTGALRSVERFDLEGSSFTAKVVPDTANSSSTCWMLANDTEVPPSDFDVRNELYMQHEGGNLVLGYRTGGTPSQTTITYSDTDHAWWGLRADSTNVYWETSPDGETWTTRRTVAIATIGWAPNAVDLYFGAGYWDAGGATPDPFIVEQVGHPQVGENVYLEGVGDAAALHTGALAVARPVEGGTDSAALHTGALAAARLIGGGSDAAALHTGAAALTLALIGASDTAAEHTGALSVPRLLDGVSHAAAAHQATLARAHKLTGGSDAAARHDGAATVGRVLEGLSDAAVLHTGALAVARPVEGGGDTAAEHTGALRVGHALAGSSDAAGEHPGALLIGRRLSGVSDAAAEHVGTIDLGDVVHLAGTSDAVADHSGPLHVSRALACTADAAAVQTAELAVSRRLGGTSDAATDDDAQVLVGRALAGSSDASTAHAGSLQVARPLEGRSDAAAEHTGALDVSGSMALAGASDAAADHGGTLHVGRVLAGATDAVGGHAGQLDVGRLFEGQADAAADHDGTLRRVVDLAGVCDAVTDHGGAVHVSRRLRGRADAAAHHRAHLRAGRALAGACDVAAAHSGRLLIGEKNVLDPTRRTTATWTPRARLGAAFTRGRVSTSGSQTR